MKFNNPWMRLEETDGKQFIVSDGLRFLVTFTSTDNDALNEHCADHDDRGVIATDENGLSYVAMMKAE
jgi:hypothetical protein